MSWWVSASTNPAVFNRNRIEALVSFSIIDIYFVALFCYPISFRFFMLKVNHYASRKPAMFVFLQPTALRDTRTHAHVLLSYCRDCHSYDLLLIPLHAPFLSQFSGRPKHFAQQKIRSLFEFCQSQLPFYKFLISKPLS